MNAQELYRKKDNEYTAIRWYCNNCGTIHSTKENAEECCKPIICTKCGKEISRDRNKGFENYYVNPTRCYDCFSKDKENAMEVITEEEYKGEPLTWNDNYYSDLEDFMETEGCIFENMEDIPDYLQICEEVNIRGIDIDRVLERIQEDTYIEDIYENIFVDVGELKTFVQKWNEKQTFTYYEPISKKLKLSDKTRQEIMEM